VCIKFKSVVYSINTLKCCYILSTVQKCYKIYNTCLCLLLFSFISKCDLVSIHFRCISTVFHPVFYFDSFSIHCSACYTWSKFCPISYFSHFQFYKVYCCLYIYDVALCSYPTGEFLKLRIFWCIDM
jgi:hypothetical protein